MIIIGLTGSIGMGKTTIANMFADLGVPVLDSDKVVHALLEENKTIIANIARHFPAALKNGKLDRSEIGKAVFADAKKLKALEAILHPAVRKAQQAFIKNEKQKKQKAVILDIPLLFETGAEKRVDHVVVVTAPAIVQKARVMKRPGMSQEKFRRIIKRQMTDTQKRKKADFIIHNGGTKQESLRQVKQILKVMLSE